MGQENKRDNNSTYDRLIDTIVYDDDKLELLVKEIGKNVRKEREKRNWSSTELSNRSNINNSHIYKIESGLGNIGIAAVLKFCIAFGISPNDLIPLDDVQKVRTNGDRFDEITRNAGVETVNFLLDMAEQVVHLNKKNNNKK